MQSLIWRINLAVVAIPWLLSSPPCRFGNGSENRRIVSKPLPSFHVAEVTVVDALFRLGEGEGIPIGIEYVDRDALSKRVTVAVGPTTVGDVVAALLAKAPGYRWELRDGVLHIVHPTPMARRNLLDFVLPRFEIEESGVQEASHQLQMALLWALRPGVRGVAGDYSPGSGRNMVGPLRLQNVTVRQVLDRLVGEKKNAAWVVQVAPGHLDQLPPNGLWKIVEYNDAATMDHVGDLLLHTIFGYGREPSDSH